MVGNWLTEVANVRVHATLGERLIDRKRREQGLLTPLPQTMYQIRLLCGAERHTTSRILLLRLVCARDLLV